MQYANFYAVIPKLSMHVHNMHYVCIKKIVYIFSSHMTQTKIQLISILVKYVNIGETIEQIIKQT